MVIDDSLAVRRVVEICLGRAGISTMSFSGGVEAITALGRGEIAPPKVLLLDVGMPRMNGYDVAKKLRSNAAFRDIRLFMLTGHDGILDRAYARVLGVGFIPKPFRSHDLLTIVCEALGMRVPDNRWRLR
jgi:CheY-like chemotaxis protein